MSEKKADEREAARLNLRGAAVNLVRYDFDEQELTEAALEYAKAYDWKSPIDLLPVERELVELRGQLKLARTLLELHEREVPLAVRRKLIEALDPTEQTSRIEALAKLKVRP